MAQDSSPTIPAIQHAVKVYEEENGVYVDAVMILQPTSPLRTTSDIDSAIEYMNSWFPDRPAQYYDCLISIVNGVHPVKSYEYQAGSELKPFLPQDEPYDKHKHICYTRNSAIFILRRRLLDQGRLIGDVPIYYIMPKSRSIDIDDMEDMKMAEALLKCGEAH